MNKLVMSLVACCLVSLFSVGASATLIHPLTNEWYSFDVDEFLDADLGWIDAQSDLGKGYLGDSSALSFTFSVSTASLLTIVDAGIAGDEFGIQLNGVEYFSSQVSSRSDSYAGVDFDAAWVDPAFSQLTLWLDAGTYSLSGFLSQSALDAEGFEFNATVGAIKITAVNEPGGLVLLVLLSVVLVFYRRRFLTHGTGLPFNGAVLQKRKRFTTMIVNGGAKIFSLLLLPACAIAADVPVKIIAFNDFHGQLDAPGTFRANAASPSPTIPVGGVAWMAAYVDALKAQGPHSVVVSAGDLIGASPLVSALFHDEPTIEAMNRLGLEFNAVGNHEFDEGKSELIRMQEGGCHPTDPNSCMGGSVGTPVPFEGAKFSFLAANVVDTTTNKTVFAPYAIKSFGGVRIAFIGMTLKDTPTIVSPSGVKGLVFNDEAATVNALIPKLRARGVKAVVVLVHQGGTQPVSQAADTINSCVGNLASTPLLSLVSQLDNEVDLVISGHTHQAYNCVLPNKVGREISVTSANSIGRVLTDINVIIDSRTGDITRINAVNKLVDRSSTGIVPDAEITDLVANYRVIAQPIANRVIGEITAAMPDSAVNAAGESALGDVIADAQLHATAAVGFGEAVASFMNPGGIRAPGFIFESSPAGEGDGRVTYGEAFTVQPFGNSLTTLTLTGEQIHILLEQQFTGCNATNAPAEWGYPVTDTLGQSFNRILQVSDGFTYAWTASRPACNKVDPATIQIGGHPLNLAASYRITVNNFLADGGDKFYILTQGTGRLGGAQDIDALEAWFNNPAADSNPDVAGIQVAPGPQNRITRLN